jgi:plastocyanin
MRNFVIITIVTAAALIAMAAPAGAAEHVVTQKDGAFSVSTLKAKSGDEVVFKNDDKVFHNVFSFSKILPFDLGAYGQGQSRKVKVADPGKILVECAIHPNMSMTIDVSR